MKRILPLFSLMLLLGSLTARAQSDMIIKQRARALQNGNNAQPAAPPPAAPAPAAPTVPPPPQGMSADQKVLVDKLEADLTAIKPGSTNTVELKQALTNDFSALIKSGTKPTPASLTKLAADLSAALSAGGVSGRDLGQLAKAINVVMNSASVNTAQAQSFVVVAQTSLKSSGVADPDLKTVTDDLKGIVTDVQKSRPKLYQ
jgi:hypothetical protein